MVKVMTGWKWSKRNILMCCNISKEVSKEGEIKGEVIEDPKRHQMWKGLDFFLLSILCYILHTSINQNCCCDGTQFFQNLLILIICLGHFQSKFWETQPSHWYEIWVLIKSAQKSVIILSRTIFWPPQSWVFRFTIKGVEFRESGVSGLLGVIHYQNSPY